MAWAVSTFPLHLQEKELFLKQWNDSMLLISEHTHHPRLTSQPPIVPRRSSETRSCSVKPSPPTVPFSTASSSAKTNENRKKSSGPQDFGFLRLEMLLVLFRKISEDNHLSTSSICGLCVAGGKYTCFLDIL